MRENLASVTSGGGATWCVRHRIEGGRGSTRSAPTPSLGWLWRGLIWARSRPFLREDKDPVIARRLSRAATAAGSDNTFKAVAEEWLAMKRKEWSAVHYSKSQRALERDIFPSLGNLPVDSITPAIIAKAIEDIGSSGAAQPARRTGSRLRSTFPERNEGLPGA